MCFCRSVEKIEACTASFSQVQLDLDLAGTVLGNGIDR